jgi:MFS family permease
LNPWDAAGLVGRAVGPAAGGLLTQLLSWQAIFVFQVPVIVLATEDCGETCHGTGLPTDETECARSSAA